MARRLRHPPDSTAVGISKSVNPARPSVSANRAARSSRGIAMRSRSAFDHGANRLPGREFRHLRDATQPRPFTDRKFPAIRFHAPFQNREQRRLTRPVRADQPDAVAIGYRE